MAQNPADNLIDTLKNNFVAPVQKVLNTVDKVIPDSWVPKPKDTGWHSDMVRKANESFQKAAESKPPSKTVPAKYHKGTDYVPKTGPAILKKGEAVLNKEEADKFREAKGKSMAEKSHGSSRASRVLGGKGKSKSKSSAKHPHRLTIRHGKSGGHVVTHHYDEPDENGVSIPDEDHVMPDKESLLQHIDQNTPDVPAPQAPAPEAASAASPAGGSVAVAPPPPPGM